MGLTRLTDNHTELLTACLNNNINRILELLRLLTPGSLDGVVDEDQSTPLHLLAAHPNPDNIQAILAILDAAQQLIDKGAVVNAQNQAQVTALMVAAKAGCQPLVEKLLDNGADPLITCVNGLTPLHIALMQAKDISQMADYLETALVLAQKCPEAFTMKDAYEQTPLDYLVFQCKIFNVHCKMVALSMKMLTLAHDTGIEMTTTVSPTAIAKISNLLNQLRAIAASKAYSCTQRESDAMRP